MSELRDAGAPSIPRAQDRAGCRPLARCETRPDLSGSEVHQHQAAVGRAAHHVLRLHVAVDDARVVDRHQRPAQILSPRQRLARAARPLAVDRVVQRRAFDEIHPEAEPAAVHVGAVHHHHVGMPHAHQHAGFLEHAGAVGDVGLQQLQRDVVAQPEIAGEEHLAKVPSPTFLTSSKLPHRLPGETSSGPEASLADGSAGAGGAAVSALARESVEGSSLPICERWTSATPARICSSARSWEIVGSGCLAGSRRRSRVPSATASIRSFSGSSSAIARDTLQRESYSGCGCLSRSPVPAQLWAPALPARRLTISLSRRSMARFTAARAAFAFGFANASATSS